MVTASVPTSEGVEPGTYRGRFSTVEEKSSDAYGAFWAWRFDALVGDDVVEVGGASSPKLGSMTKARRWVEALLGRDLEPGEAIDFEALAGRPCMLVVEPDAKGFGKVADVLPPLRGSAPDAGLDDLPF